MDRLKQMLATISASLSTLGTSGKIIAALAMGLLVTVFILVAMWSSKPAMEPLMPGAPPQAQQAAAAVARQRGIPTGTSGGNVTVSPENRDALMGWLAEEGKLPDDTTVLFSNLSSKQNWMNSNKENDRQANLALMGELERVIRHFPSVSKVNVFIEAPEAVGLGQAYRKPTASVIVFPKGGRALTQQTVDAVASLVAGAKAGLSPSDVKVIDGISQRPFKVRAEGDFAAGDYLEHVAKIEDRVQGKLLETLKYIGGVIVAVNAQADVRKTTVSETKVLPNKAGSESFVSKESTKDTNSSSGSAGGEPGAGSNVTMDINRGGGGATKQTDATTETEFNVGLGRRVENTVDPRGMPTKVNVTINVPREYITDLIRVEKNDPKAEVTQADIDQKFTAEKDRISKDIQPLVETLAGAAGTGPGPVQAGVVTVSMIPVATPGAGAARGVAMAGLGGDSSGLLGTLSSAAGGGLVKQVFLGVLALAALGMMFMLVRKSASPIELPSAQEIVGVPPALEGDADVVGEADETQTAMEGIELEDGQLKVKKMLEQVTDMVKKNPGDAAVMLNRWMQIEN